MYPNLLHIGHLTLPTFGLLAALGLAAAMSLGLRTAPLAGVSPDALWNAGLFTVFAAFLTSRLLLVLFNLRSFLAAPVLLLMVPSLTAAGLLLTAVATAIYLRLHRLPLLAVLDAWAAPGVLLWAFLALGHLAEASDPGLPSRFGLALSRGAPREHPVALYATVAALTLALVLFKALRRQPLRGQVAAVAMASAGLVQFLLTFLRRPYLYEAPTPLALLDPMEWVALVMVLAGGLLWVVSAAQHDAASGTRGMSGFRPHSQPVPLSQPEEV